MTGFAAWIGLSTVAAVLDELVAGLIEAAADVDVGVAEVAAGAAVDEDGLAAVVVVDGLEVAGIEPRHW